MEYQTAPKASRPHTVSSPMQLANLQPYGNDFAQSRMQAPPLAKMNEESAKKDQELIESGRLKYMDDETRQRFRIARNREGRLARRGYHDEGDEQELQAGTYGYGVDEFGELYGTHTNPWGQSTERQMMGSAEFCHSVFTGGRDMQTAGFFSYDDEEHRIAKMNRSSGHYRPEKEQQLSAMRGLLERGLIDEDVLMGNVAEDRILRNDEPEVLRDLLGGRQPSLLDEGTQGGSQEVPSYDWATESNDVVIDIDALTREQSRQQGSVVEEDGEVRIDMSAYMTEEELNPPGKTCVMQ